MSSVYDAIVVGGGHNGLVTAGYLARARWSVLVLERRHVVGGACVTEEVFPGYRVSTAAYLCSLMQDRVVRDLELARYGYRVIPKEPAYFAPYPDGRHMLMWSDRERTCREIAKFSAADAGRYGEYESLLERLAELVEAFWLESPPALPPGSLRDWLGLARAARRFLGLSRREMDALIALFTGSAADFLDRWFESEQLRVALVTDGVIGSASGPRTPGTGYLLLHHVMGNAAGRRGLWGFVEGGMGGVTQALARSAEDHGAEIATESEVTQIRVRDGQARGVVLADGREYDARVVVSNLEPKRTLLDLVGRDHLDPEFADAISHLKVEGAAFKVNLALDALPEYSALPGTEAGPQHRGTTHIAPDMGYVELAHLDAQQGRPSERPLLEITIPTVYEPDLAPPGKHIMSIFVQYAPYRLEGASWHEERERFADRVIEVLAEYAPNVPDAISDRHLLSPLDMEREYGMTGGHIFHGEMSPDQLFFRRPALGWARYATPIRNLYLCGSGTHPGGGVTGAPGHNAAREILRSGKSVNR